MRKYTVGTQLTRIARASALGVVHAAGAAGLFPPLFFTVPLKENSGNTQWRVCLLAHTLLLCSWFRVTVHSRYTVGTQWYTVAAAPADKWRDAPTFSPLNALARVESAA